MAEPADLEAETAVAHQQQDEVVALGEGSGDAEEMGEVVVAWGVEEGGGEVEGEEECATRAHRILLLVCFSPLAIATHSFSLLI